MDKVPAKRTPARVKATKLTKVKTEVNLVTKKIRPNLKEVPTSVKKDSISKSIKKIARTLPVKKVTKRAKSESEEVRLIPGTISLRLAEKRRLYERVYQKYVPKVMRPIAITGGYAYVAVGIFLALFMASPSLTNNFLSQSASVNCFSGECEFASTTEAAVTTAVRPVEFIPLAPIAPGLDTNLQLLLNYETPVRLTLLPISGGDVMTIDGVAESASDLVNFLLPTASLRNGNYLVQAELYNEETKQVKQKFIGPPFVVANIIVELAPKEEVVEVAEEDSITEPIVEKEGEVLGVSTSTTPAGTETDLETIAEEKSDNELVLTAVAEEINTPDFVPVKKSEAFDLMVIPGTSENQSIIKILPTFVFEKVELYLKSKGEGETFFLGQATKADEAWFYWLDNTIIPNGSYSLIIIGFDGGIPSGEAAFTFTNQVKPVLTSDIDLAEVESKVDTLLSDALDTDELTTLRSSYVTSYVKVNETDQLKVNLKDYLPRFDRLFTNYAGAVAGGNEAIIILADEQIEKYLDSVVVDENTDQVLSFELNSFLVNVRNFVRVKEAELLKVSGGFSAIDSDKDGFTDYDEVVLYATDPILADTDNDGIIDSVETILGYNPTDEKLEVVSRIADQGLGVVINGDLLSISAIQPLYLYTDKDSTPKVLTSVSGRGVPNSFSRLYLGDLPESVIVKIGPDGTFTQTIDKEFVKIEGRIVLALTDNSGRIVLRGQPLQVDKVLTSRELFNSTALDAAVVKSVKEFTTSNVIGALGVVSFGLILLLLGKALVPRRESISLEIA